MSAILSADDLNDFISPGVACIKPVESLPLKESQSENPYEVTKEDKVQPENLPPAQISLTDCLACSGCVTSAEAVLISLQSHTEVLNTLDSYPELPLDFGSDQRATQNVGSADSDGRIFVASVSPQVRASLAATYGITEREAKYMIDQFLMGPHGLRAGGKHRNGFTWVVDTNIMREAVLALTADEVTSSLLSTESGSLPKRPILSSACPGWICYAEKTHPFILPHLSRLKSPQALSGTFLKSVLSKALGVPPSQIWHLAIMPCFDKKLEASREELTDIAWASTSTESQTTPVRDVDCVITTRELLTLASARGLSLPNLPLKALPASCSTPFPDQALDSFLFSKSSSGQTVESGTSGGYLHHVLRIFQARNPGSKIVTQRGRNADVVEYVLMSSGEEPLLKAARYYGFRNIQNLVRKLKPARVSRLPGAKPQAVSSSASRRQPWSRIATPAGTGADYAYVEVMACPGGCTNGGGQIRIEDAREAIPNTLKETSTEAPVAASKPTPHEQRAWLARVDEAYYSADSDSERSVTTEPVSVLSRDTEIHEFLKYWSEKIDIPLSQLVYTSYREVESDVGKTQNAPNETARVVELAGKIGGGW
ncbi:iron-sulfur cluster assembly protein NAR1 [Aspergillus novofumigatus IBT 16806]|uniref:Cytosolic Fe-S cluster assembly factor NAR1 n=1 Tax=Aspergillus novofumigatus (strain IBT 16806) TaxID=1392255 RepID=A0A2I1C4P6_ASPN1|nr:putative iron-sulfur cluster assembly associated protein Nar1 [Aspergillus novofumigatus IBT 16806]PKX92588.1 putative iron-sulfur cluster assembly associated protein Nar1 [Aspergillus novofumigatus IBT 16806]